MYKFPTLIFILFSISTSCDLTNEDEKQNEHFKANSLLHNTPVKKIKIEDQSNHQLRYHYNPNLINKLEGQWYHQKDTSLSIHIQKQQWISLCQSNSIIKTDSFNLLELSELPKEFQTIVQTDFLRLSNLTDTIYYEVLGYNDSCFSLMHYPSMQKHQYQRTITPQFQEVLDALKNEDVNDYFKEVYYKEHLIMADDTKILSITDSLFTNNTKTELFYFLVFTKSMNGSDGFYSEALGLSAFDYITEKTNNFAEYFSTSQKLDDDDFANWVDYVYGEIRISSEGHEAQAIKELESQLLKNIKASKKENQLIIELFLDQIRQLHKSFRGY